MKNSHFGDNLKFYRKQAGLTQKELGDKTNISQVVIANYERGARFPGELNLRILAEALNISLDYLLSVSTIPLIEQSPELFDITTFLDILLNDPVIRGWEYLKSWMKSENYNVLQTYSNILVDCLRRTGDLWFTGSLTISEEHIISSKVRDLITLVSLGALDSVKTRTKKKWMGICAPGENHDLALFMTAQLMQIEGWQVKFIGTNVPVSDLMGLVEIEQPDVFCVSITQRSHLDGLESYLKVLDDNKKNEYKLILGGSGISLLDLNRFPMVYGLAESLEDGINLA